jgi:hypothetical protein
MHHQVQEFGNFGLKWLGFGGGGGIGGHYRSRLMAGGKFDIAMRPSVASFVASRRQKRESWFPQKLNLLSLVICLTREFGLVLKGIPLALCQQPVERLRLRRIWRQRIFDKFQSLQPSILPGLGFDRMLRGSWQALGQCLYGYER